MKTFKEILQEALKTHENILEGIKQDIDKLFSGNKEYVKLKKAAKTNPDKELDLIVLISSKEKELNKILKQYKLKPEDVVKAII